MTYRASCARVLAMLLLAAVAPTDFAFAQTIEDVRHEPELRACAALPESERKSCVDRVRAKIGAEWKARIEEQSRRRTSN